jgi:F0F1-type ATP synthase assembly protein I
MTPDDTRNWVRQEDDAWSRAMELALTPVVAGGIGYIVDRIAGTVPVFTIVFLVLAVVGTFVKMYYAYDAKMKAHDAEAPWGRAQSRAAEQQGNAAAVPAPRSKKRDAAADHAAADRAAADHLISAPDRTTADRATADRSTADRSTADRRTAAAGAGAEQGADQS